MKKLGKMILSGIIVSYFILNSTSRVLANETGINQNTLQTTFNEIDEYVTLHNENEAAVSISVVNADEVLYQKNYGYANKKQNILAKDETIYEWGSLSKVLTWISVMQLWEQGKIDLNEDITTYLPEHYLKKLTKKKAVTMIDLMNHTGGWQDSITNVYTKHKLEVLPLEEYVQKYEPIQLYEPGSVVAYSNWGTTLAGYIVERVSGEDYCTYIKKHIFEPLGMEQTSINPLRNDNTFVSDNIQNITGYTISGREIAGNFYVPDYPAAGAAGTAMDVQKFMQALLGSNQLKLFKQDETLALMMKTTNYFADSEHPESAHGLWHDSYTVPTLGHYGNTPQFSTHMALAPKENLGMLIMTNQAQEMVLNHGAFEILFGNGKVTPKDEIYWKEYQYLDYYTGARTIETGFCRFYHFFQLYQVKKTGKDTILISSPFMKISCNRIGDKIYRADSGFCEGYYFYLSVDEKGVVQKISTSTFDIIPYTSYKAIIETISFILLGVVLLVSIVIAIIQVLQRIKKKKIKWITFIMNLFSIGFYVVVLWEAMKLISTAASSSDLYPAIGAYIGYMIVGTGYVISLFIRKQRQTIDIIVGVVSCYIMIFSIYWQLFLLK